MKLAPDFPIDHKVKACICGKSKELYEVNRKKYQNAIFSAIFGGLGLLVAMAMSPFILIDDEEISKTAWVVIFGGWVLLFFIILKIVKLVKKKHSIACAFRSVVVDFAK